VRGRARALDLEAGLRKVRPTRKNTVTLVDPLGSGKILNFEK